MTGEKRAPEASQADEVRPFQVLLAYDGSDHAKAAVQLMVDLARVAKECLQDCKMTMMTVMPTQYITGHEGLEASLMDASERMRAGGLQVTSVIKAGNPADSINNYTQEIGADLIVIGAKGLRSTLGILLGGVAQQVVEYSSLPVLVVRSPYKGLRRLLLVVDGSPYSQNAAGYMCLPQNAARTHRFPVPPDSDVFLMHVLPPSIPDEMISRAWTVGPEVLYPAPLPPINKEAIEASEEDGGNRILQDTSASLLANGIKSQPILKRGDAASEIMEFVKVNQIDLIVCGSRGLSQVAGWLLGSVSRKLVHYADCSILIVKQSV